MKKTTTSDFPINRKVKTGRIETKQSEMDNTWAKEEQRQKVTLNDVHLFFNKLWRRCIRLPLWLSLIRIINFGGDDKFLG